MILTLARTTYAFARTLTLTLSATDRGYTRGNVDIAAQRKPHSM